MSLPHKCIRRRNVMHGAVVFVRGEQTLMFKTCQTNNNIKINRVFLERSRLKKTQIICKTVPFHLTPIMARSIVIFSPIDQYRKIKLILKKMDEAPGNNPHKLCSYSPQPRAEVYFLRLDFNRSKLVYSLFSCDVIIFQN